MPSSRRTIARVALTAVTLIAALLVPSQVSAASIGGGASPQIVDVDGENVAFSFSVSGDYTEGGVSIYAGASAAAIVSVSDGCHIFPNADPQVVVCAVRSFTVVIDPKVATDELKVVGRATYADTGETSRVTVTARVRPSQTNLAVAASADPATVTQGQNATFLYTVSNTSAVAVAGANLAIDRGISADPIVSISAPAAHATCLP